MEMLTAKTICNRYAVTESQLKSLIRWPSHRFPNAVKIPGRGGKGGINTFNAKDVEAWFASHIKQGNQFIVNPDSPGDDQRQPHARHAISQADLALIFITGNRDAPRLNSRYGNGRYRVAEGREYR